MNTVTVCTKAKDWDNGKGQVVPIYKVDLSDGRSGQSFGKEIPVGTNESEIEITEGQYGLKFKLASPKNGFAGYAGAKRSGNESFAMSYSKDLCVAGKIELKDLSKYADLIYTWLENKKSSLK